MTLRQRTALTIIVACALAVIGTYFIVQAILSSHSRALEREIATHDLEQASRALSQEVATVETAVEVWAPWDDTYRFMQDGNAEYIASNLNASTLLNLDIDFVVYVDPEGQVFYSKAVDAASGTEVPMPAGLEQFVTGEDLLARHESETSSVSGIMFLPDNLALVASQPILTSQREGPIAGSLVMGRCLDSEVVQRLREATDLSVELYRVDDTDLPEDFRLARAALSDGHDTVVRVSDSDTIGAYTLVSEVHGNPAFVLGISEPRDVYAAGQRTARNILYLLLGVGGLFSLLLTLEIDTLVMCRLRRLAARVAAVSESGNLSDRVSVGGKDEVTAVAQAVNTALSSREKSHHDLIQSEARNQTLLEAIPDLVFWIDKEGRISGVRRPQRTAGASESQGDEHCAPDEVADLIPAHVRQTAMSQVHKAIESRQTQVLEFQMPTDRGVFHHEARIVANSDRDAMVIVRDVTNQKNAEEARQNSLLLKEIHNRVKNHLRTIRSFPEIMGGSSPQSADGSGEHGEAGNEMVGAVGSKGPHDSR
ncbi:MAG: CHASE4 domain-containing protein [Dehalococcoidia bacterium]|nr:CHASE4 domain-containing protein [Dehalococcoidia bacterium]